MKAPMIRRGDFVIDMSDIGRIHYRAVYRVEMVGEDRTLVSYVGSVVNGRIEFARDRSETYRTTTNLKKWEQ